MNGTQDPNSKLPLLIIVLGVFSGLSVLFALRIFSQRSQGDAFFVSPEYQSYQSSPAAQHIRQEVAKEFVSAIVDCLAPPIAPGQNLTKEEFDGRVASALEKLSGPVASRSAACRKSRTWTFARPCKLTIEGSGFGLGSASKLGDITLCGSAISASLQAHAEPCANSADFQACLVQSVLANEAVKRAIAGFADAGQVPAP
ncbi:MAG TPA: hypothetical protein VME69_16060 [Methylocella sp.]|nr:hypothetical protein [Methylocella sp.]